MRALKWVLVAAVAIVVLIVGGTWVYINVIRDDPPERLTFDTRDEAATTLAPATTAAGGTTPVAVTAGVPTTAATSGATGIDGTWTATSASELGYRVTEILFGQSTEGVGRTNSVTGSLTIVGTTVNAADFTVDMASITSDSDRRDGQFRGRIMDTANFPTATFVLTSPIELGRVPPEREEVAASATGELTLRGTTRPVTFDVLARLDAGTIQVNGAIEIVFADWGIPNPDAGPADTEDEGLLEFLLVFDRAV